MVSIQPASIMIVACEDLFKIFACQVLLPFRRAHFHNSPYHHLTFCSTYQHLKAACPHMRAIIRKLIFFLQAGRLIANLIVAGGGILIRAAAQAYRQALVSKSIRIWPLRCLCGLDVCRQPHCPTYGARLPETAYRGFPSHIYIHEDLLLISGTVT